MAGAGAKTSPESNLSTTLPPQHHTRPPPPTTHHHKPPPYHHTTVNRNQSHDITYHDIAPGSQDRYAFGVIAEAMRGCHIFTSSHQVGMIMSIFSTWGAPRGGERDILRTLPHWSETFPNGSRPMKWVFWGEAAEALLDSMLSYDRHKRTTVAGVSGHAFFQVTARKGDVLPWVHAHGECSRGCGLGPGSHCQGAHVQSRAHILLGYPLRKR